MGHMLEHTEIDVTVRWHRMRGDNTLWLPGTDHAGIATQMVVERQLAAEGINAPRSGPRGVRKARLGMEGRIRRHDQEADDPHRRQLRLVARALHARSGACRAPCAKLSSGLYESGLIYRGEYMVNWCPRCQTAISDLETVHEETQGHLVAHPLSGGRQRIETLVVATTRPETMLGDTAVAINPKDERYQRPARQERDAAADGSRDPDHSRRSGRPGVRHRRGEGDAGARSERFRSGQAPQSAA